MCVAADRGEFAQFASHIGRGAAPPSKTASLPPVFCAPSSPPGKGRAAERALTAGVKLGDLAFNQIIVASASA